MARVDPTSPSGAPRGAHDPVPPTRGRSGMPSVRPALVVLGIAAALVLLFGIGAAIQGSSSSTSAPRPHHVAGVSLAAEPAAALLRPIETPGTPPNDVLASVVVPAGTTRTGATPSTGTTQFSAKADFEVAASQSSVVDFYRAELEARGWSSPDVSATQTPEGAIEVLAQRASADGWYWEIGVVVSPSTFSTSSRGDRTPFTLELFEVPDPE